MASNSATETPSSLRRNSDFCVKKKVKCPGDLDGQGCRHCRKKKVSCHFSLRLKPGPKGRKRQVQDGDGCGGGGAGGESGSPLMTSSPSSTLLRPAKKRKNVPAPLAQRLRGSEEDDSRPASVHWREGGAPTSWTLAAHGAPGDDSLGGARLDGGAGSSGTQLSKTAMQVGRNLDGVGGGSAASAGSSGTQLSKTVMEAGRNLDGAGDGSAAIAGSSGPQLSKTAMEAGRNLDGVGDGSAASAASAGGDGGGFFGGPDCFSLEDFEVDKAFGVTSDELAHSSGADEVMKDHLDFLEIFLSTIYPV